MLKDKYKTMRLSAVEQNIDNAIQRVYDAYGTDLSAFFKKVQREAHALDDSEQIEVIAEI